jgi:hypothetical protein|tara:strand:+ start:391 stop:543 length:153 start_codon:yes stop_codon:yes gene_type:complete
MKYLIVLLLLVSCGIKPSASCSVGSNKIETIKDIKDDCVENPHVEIKKEF